MRLLLTTGRLPFLILVAVLTAVLGYRAVGVQVEISNESMNARDADIVAARERLRRDFGHDEDLLVAVTAAEAADLPSAVDRLGRAIRGLEGVRAVHSIANFEQAVPGRVGAELVPLVRASIDSPEALEELNASLDRNAGLTGLLISADRRTAAIVVETDHDADDDRHAGRLIDAVRALALEAELADDVDVRVTGVAVQKHDVSRFVGRDQAVLIPAAVVVIAVVLWAFFRSFAAVVLPLAVTGLTLVWTIGAYAWAGFALNTVTSLLPPVVMILSIATTVHVYSAWISPSAAETRATERLMDVVERMRFPCSFTSLTTAIGLASLVLSNTPAVQLFGAFSALGVMIAFCLSFSLVPVLLSFAQAPVATPDTGRLRRVLERLVEVSTRRPAVVVWVAGGVLLTALLAVPSIRSNTDLVRFLLPDAELRRDTIWLDRNFGAVNALDVVVWRPDAAALDGLADLQALERFTKAADGLPGVRRVLGPVDVVSQLNRAELDLDEPRLPTHQADVDYLFELLDVFGDDATLSRFLSADRRRARVAVGVGAIGTAEAGELIGALDAAASATLGTDLAFEITGAFHQISVGSQRIVRDQIVTFATALVLVVVLIGLAFRSLTITWIALIPNVLPIVVSAAVMGVLKIDLSTGTAMIASVVMGLAVDDTIHYLTRFRRERRFGSECATAIRATTIGTGRILTLTSVVLALGFWVGALGSFTPTIYFSLFSGLTMLVALACDLLVLPACLMLARRRVDRWVARTNG